MTPFVAALLLLPGSALDTPRERIEAVAKDYGIQIEILDKETKYSRPGYNVVAQPMTDKMLEAYEPIFIAEWSKYPKSIARHILLSKIVIGSNVRVLDQPRAAVPEFIPGWFWLDGDVGGRSPRYGRHVLHHDFFHMIDEWDSADGRRDKAWEKLNAPDAKYGKGGWFMQSGNVGALRKDIPGFITEYSTSAVEEDKAEIYAHLLTSPAFVAERVAADQVIAAKAARIKELVKAFDPTMDAAWFKRSEVPTPPAKE